MRYSLPVKAVEGWLSKRNLSYHCKGKGDGVGKEVSKGAVYWYCNLHDINKTTTNKQKLKKLIVFRLISQLFDLPLQKRWLLSWFLQARFCVTVHQVDERWEGSPGVGGQPRERLGAWVHDTQEVLVSDISTVLPHAGLETLGQLLSLCLCCPFCDLWDGDTSSYPLDCHKD